MADAANRVRSIPQTLFANENAIDQCRAKIISHHKVSRDVTYRYFSECVNKTISRELVEKALATLGAVAAAVRFIASEVLTHNPANNLSEILERLFADQRGRYW